MGQRGRGGRGLLPNIGEGFDVNPPVGRNNGNQSQTNEIGALRRQVATLMEMVQRMQPATEGSDRSEDTRTHFENPFATQNGHKI